MFERLKLKMAKKHDTNRVLSLFASVDSDLQRRDVEGWIGNREVFVLKDKKRIRGAFSFTALGVMGLFGILYIRKLAVEQTSRRMGIGSLLISKIKGLSLKMGTAAFFLFSLQKAIRFYEKNKLNGLGRLFWWRKKD